ncbi:MAG: transglycosylase domain-containing protein, partial [Chloroflexota bacterium]
MRARRSSHATKLVRGIPRATGYGSAFGAGRSLGPRVRRRAFSGLPPRPRGRSILLTLGVLLGVLLLTGVVVVTATAGAVGVAAVATVNMLSTDLPDPKQLDALTFSQPTVVYDRTGKIELGRFQREQRSVVSFDRIPKLVLDSTVTAEDRSFWTNAGYDPTAILGAVAENVSGAGDRGASTITQQLVRARLLPQEYVEPGADRYLRKAKELVQSARVTQAFPGEAGKERIIT